MAAKFSIMLTTLLLLLAGDCFAAEQQFWNNVAPGYDYAIYEIPTNQAVVKSEVILLRFSLQQFTIEAATAEDVSTKRTSVNTLAKKHRAVAAINTNFFDPDGAALGLIVKKGNVISRLQKGGSLLTGVFYLDYKNNAGIVHRDSLPKEKPKVAFQAGPRLIANNKPLKLKERHQPTRRSGVAIDDKGNVIIFATRLRYPGASFGQLQDMLLDKRVAAVNALNFDGGGSSQLFIQARPPHFNNDKFITGGDVVPTALIIKKK